MARLPLPAVSAPPPSRSGGPPSALGVDAPPTLPTRPTPNPEPTCVDLRYIRPITSNSTWPTPGATDPPGSSDPGPSPASAHSSDEDELARRAEPAGGLWSSPDAGTSDSDDASFARASPSRDIAEPVLCVCYGRGTKTRLLPNSARQHPPPHLSRSAIVVRKPQPPPPPPSSPTPPSSFPALAPPRRNSAGGHSKAPLPPPSYPTGPPPPARPTKIAAAPRADAALARLVITLPGDHRGAACTYKYLARVGPSQRAIRREALRIVRLERGEEVAVAAAASVRQVTLGRDDEVYEVGDLGDDLSGVFADGIPRFFVDVRFR